MNKLRDARNRVLAVLQAHPQGIQSNELAIETNTSRSQARIGELRKAGWRISTTYDGSSGFVIYTLHGKDAPKPIPDMAFKIRVYGGRVTVHPYRPRGLSGKYGEFSQHEVGLAIKKAVKGWLEDHTPFQGDTTPKADPEPVQVSLLADTPPVDAPVDNYSKTDTFEIDTSFIDSLIGSMGEGGE